jgi:hypothetical protein
MDDLRQPAIRRLGWLRFTMALGIDVSRGLRDFHFVLERLPLTTSEFALAGNRLKNAVGYVASAEHGAAQ